MPGQKFSSDDFLTDSTSSKYYSPSEFLESSFSENFTMLHLNIASLSKHIDELNNLLKILDFSFDIIGITETRLKLMVMTLFIHLHRLSVAVQAYISNQPMIMR